MTYQPNCTLPTELLEQIAAEGLDALPELIRILINEQGAAVEPAPGKRLPPVVFCHGFPMLWFSWHRQIPVLARAGYRVIAPSMRGMGQTAAPADPSAYGVDHITGDLLGAAGGAFLALGGLLGAVRRRLG